MLWNNLALTWYFFSDLVPRCLPMFTTLYHCTICTCLGSVKSYILTGHVPVFLFCHATYIMDHPAYSICECIQVKGVYHRLPSTERIYEMAPATKDQPKWSFLFVRSQFVQPLCVTCSTALDFLFSSSRLLTSTWTMVCLSLRFAFAHCWKQDVSRFCYSMQSSYIMFLILNEHYLLHGSFCYPFPTILSCYVNFIDGFIPQILADNGESSLGHFEFFH